ncbi:MAG: hypothetical protein GW762_01410 [Candidatus Pacebacteria bacterium]|nr:hypothetical protein [Candidatus Paceibacterota bacterium]PIR63328.1 MAG: hypothetical protein COU64_05095 [Candidatus Pacebacteria bacterium CG10_big_fil_rev_8_21_14_0_10_40_26]PJA68528.1 MAG: hypothetical protein CO156_04825 [Candidatus Pacebacteria bacterium CG_4_9_14_3_um_filter_40_12]
MMKKTLHTLLLVVFMLQLSSMSAAALDVIVTSSGEMQFYSAQVLGDEDDREDSRKSEKREDSKQEDRKEDSRPEKKEVQEKPEKSVSKSSDSRLRVSAEKEKVELHIESKSDTRSEKVEDKVEFKTEQRATTDRFKLEAPSELKEARKTNLEDAKQLRNEQVEQAREERKQRTEERVEMRSQQREDGKTEFEFESRDVKAKVKNAEFVIDPETNEITIITPSGEEKTISHLPDQAVARMVENGFFDNLPEGTDPSSLELELETGEDGTVQYSTTVEKEEKLLGFFTRKYETRIELNDETGEVTEERVPTRSFLGRLLGL